MGWMIAPALLALLACISLGIEVCYGADGLRVRLMAGPVRWRLYPGRKNKKNESAKGKTLSPKGGLNQEKKSEKGGKLADFLPLVKLAMEFLGDLRRRIRVKRLDVKLILAGDDPCDLALNYARSWTAIGNLMPRLERYVVIRKRNVEVECDFQETDARVIARLDVTITLGRLTVLSVVYACRALKEYAQIRNKRKGGAVK